MDSPIKPENDENRKTQLATIPERFLLRHSYSGQAIQPTINTIDSFDPLSIISLMKNYSHRICLAPMLSYTDRHFRYLLRLISKEIFLYSEMVVTKPFFFGTASRKKFLEERFLKTNSEESPVAIQLAGNNPKELAHIAKLAAPFCDEINLNIGCPSPRVQSGEFGACLMSQPALIADCVSAIKDNIDLPVTIKTRLGLNPITPQHSDQILELITKTAAAGCELFIIHARFADLSKTTRYNRSTLPLYYNTVYELKKRFPQFQLIINGDIKTKEETNLHLQHVDGVMLGRGLYQNPFLLNENPSDKTRTLTIKEYLDYMERETQTGIPIQHLTRHLATIIKNQPHAKELRHKIVRAQSLSELWSLIP